MVIYGSGFISKASVKKMPIFGRIATGLQLIFVDRGDTNSRRNTLNEVVQRQKDFMEGKPVMPFMIFPEGTTTSGRYLLSFKKGAFVNILLVKPNFIFLKKVIKNTLIVRDMLIVLKIMFLLKKINSKKINT